MSLFGSLFSGLKKSFMPTITGFLTGGPAGAALGLGASFLGGGPSAAPAGGGGFGSFTGGLSTGLGIGQGLGQSFVQKYPTPNDFANRLGVGPRQLGQGFTPKLGASHLTGEAPGIPTSQAITLYKGGSVYRGQRFTRQSAIEYANATGMVPPGFHRTGPSAAYSIARNRHMNVLNPRALGRAMRRTRGFARYASRVVSFVKHGSHGAKFKQHRRRRA